ncbi:MAG: hypothetical protein A4E19_20630 [Nitrospira sp. SG-bin1]|nr:MAG: hypothetical protein A4E19_20630 [Nitrospira sp. SG-bin1]
MPSSQLCVPVTESSQPSAARREAVRLAQQEGLDEQEISKVALVVTELATNLVKHATRGELLIRPIERNGTAGIEVLSLDRGPGIHDVARALGDGYSTAGSPGSGLGALQRTAGEFDLYSQAGKGTVVVARIWSRHSPTLSSHGGALGVVHQAKPGETVCGDQWTVRWFADGWTCALADGLGHGMIAAAAAQPAVAAVRQAEGKRSAIELLRAAHEAAKPTRGAAFAVAVLDTEVAMVRFSGIGNIAAVVLNGDERRHLVSHNGILGHECRSATEYTQPWNKNALLLLHSDGIGTHWDFNQYPGLLSRDPSLIAGILYRDFTRGRDDATVLVVKDPCRTISTEF